MQATKQSISIIAIDLNMSVLIKIKFSFKWRTTYIITLLCRSFVFLDLLYAMLMAFIFPLSVVMPDLMGFLFSLNVCYLYEYRISVVLLPGSPSIIRILSYPITLKKIDSFPELRVRRNINTARIPEQVKYTRV